MCSSGGNGHDDHFLAVEAVAEYAADVGVPAEGVMFSAREGGTFWLVEPVVEPHHSCGCITRLLERNEPKFMVLPSTPSWSRLFCRVSILSFSASREACVWLSSNLSRFLADLAAISSEAVGSVPGLVIFVPCCDISLCFHQQSSLGE